jgi:hypothetical protein
MALRYISTTDMSVTDISERSSEVKGKSSGDTSNSECALSCEPWVSLSVWSLKFVEE